MKYILTFLLLISIQTTEAQNFHFKDFETIMNLEREQVNAYFKKKKYTKTKEESESQNFTGFLKFVSEPYKGEHRPKHEFIYHTIEKTNTKRFQFNTRDKKVFDKMVIQINDSGYKLLKDNKKNLEYEQVEIEKHYKKNQYYLVVFERYLKQPSNNSNVAKEFNQFSILLFKTDDPNPPIKMVPENSEQRR